MEKLRSCLKCDTPITGHFNRKRCEPCAELLRKRPVGKLTDKQEKIVYKFAGKLMQTELAEKVKCSRTNLIRWASERNISLNANSYKDDVIKEVCAYYENHGKVKTQKRFPKVSVRSIVERHKLFKPRCVKWKPNEIIEAIKMSGFVSCQAQARFFNRPRANAGSIHSFWLKTVKLKKNSIHGMTYHQAKHLVTKACPHIKTNHLKIVLWSDMERHFQNETPNFIKDAIIQMANFQRQLWDTDDVSKAILKMCSKRELKKELGIDVKSWAK